MMTFLGPLITVVLLAQAPAARGIAGEVVDDQGKPVADAQVVLYSPPTAYGQGESVEVRATSDAQGKFNLKVPPLKRIVVNGVQFFAYLPGAAITSLAYMRSPYRLVLEKPSPRTVTVLGADGQPVAGARVALRLIHVFGKGNAEVPASLANSLATSTGPDGKATIAYMAPRDQLVAARVTADGIGTQDILLIKRPGRDSEESAITIKLKPTSRFAGRIVDQDGRPVAGQLVEVFSRGDATWLGPNTVEFTQGPLRSDSDGSFQTPDNLMIGLPYRVAVREPGKEPILSDWITIGEKPRDLPLMVQRPARTVSGRVVDRQSNPVANIEVFQSGDGPERTTTHTDADGRFSLGGFRQGTVFVFVRGDGFRFLGRLIKPTDRNVTIELTRVSERPTREMKMLPDPITPEESRALARRLVEPLWDQTSREDQDNGRYRVLTSLATVDSARVLGLLESVKFKSEGWKNRFLREFVLTLARTDSEEAIALAESISDPATRAWALVHLADRLPANDRDKKLSLLAIALIHARTAADQSDRVLQMGEVAERWYELGEVQKAKALFAEGFKIAGQMTDKTEFKRGLFAARLARVDLPAALAIAKDFDGSRSQGRILGDIAFRLIDQNPGEAEKVWNQTKGKTRLVPMDPTLCWKMAAVDPARARGTIEELAVTQFSPHYYLFLALGSKSRDESFSRQCFETGVRRIDRLIQDSPERYQHFAGMLLPIVERIDPTLVPEVFWLDVSSRLPVGNPRTLDAYSPSYLITHLAWYDRDVAAALLEPSLARLKEASNDGSSLSTYDFRAWSLFDPRAAVARLEKLTIDPKVENNAIHTRLAVAESLAQDREERWRKIWDDWDIVLGGLKRDF
jgi:Carboxypeptidase regulatory-like domain